jgi:hypoxanthine phosphoribosyltransferase
MNAGVTGVLSDLDRVLLDEATLRDRVHAMAAEVQRDFPEQTTLTVLAIMDGALFFVADLLRRLDLPVRIVTMSASSYHGGLKSSGSVRLPWPDDLQIKGAHVLVLDDILDTGLTLAAVRERLLLEEPASVKMGVLLKKRRTQEKEVPVDYVGFEIEDEFVVGYGMDYLGKFRNLPCIGTLRL